jgi:hypothetical protein
MKKLNLFPDSPPLFILFFSLSAALFSSLAGYSAIITVDNNFPGMGAYKSLQEAHDAATDGDTIYLYPSMVSYPGISISKPLTIIGAGFGNYELSNSTTTLSGLVTFQSTSAGTSLEGFSGRFQVEIYASNVTVKRNFIKTLRIFPNVTGAVIIQNSFAKYGGEHGISILLDENTTAIIQNNKFHNWGDIGIVAGNSNTSIVVQNNVIDVYNEFVMDVTNSNHMVRNNIFTGACRIKGAVTYACTHNISARGDLPSDPTNFINVDLTTVFVNLTSWLDLHIKPGSLAYQTGYNGVDRGLYGGDLPFVDGGYPSIPSIYYLEIPVNANQKDGLNIAIKARSYQ